MSARKLTIFLGFICACALSISTAGAQPPAYTDKIFSTPDLTQTEPVAHFDSGGKNYCAPVAVSNSFVWLAEHGYPRLLPVSNTSTYQIDIPTKDEDRTIRQIELVRILSSPAFMNTKAEEGTEVDDVLLGIKRYVCQQGYRIKFLGYQGFRSSLPEFDIGSRRPKLNWLKEGILGKSGAWLNIGWYRFNSQSRTYVRIGGHWVTLVGYGVDQYNHPANNVFVIHNPAAKAGRTFHNDFIQLMPIDGVLVSRAGLRGFPRPGWGFFKIISGLPAFSDCDTAILEGAVVLELY